MNMRIPNFRLSLLVSAASVMLLTACGENTFSNPFSSTKGRKEQIVDGPRRHPQLNPCFRTGPGPINTPPCIADGDGMLPQNAPQAQAAPAPTAAPVVNNAFDQYDAQGNQVAGSAAPFKPIDMPAADPESEGEVDSSFFDRFFTKSPDAAPQPAPAAPASSDGARKSFTGNPESAAPAPQVEFKPVVTEEPKAAAAEFAPVTAKENVAAEESAPSRPSFFSRLVSPFSSGDEAKEEPKENVGDYPALSSVPATPSEFKAVKAEKDQKIEELKMDHALAQESKQNLDAEPSQLQPQVAPLPVVVNKNPNATAPAANSEPKLLGHMSDSNVAPAVEPVVQAAPAPVEYAAPQEEEKTEAESTPWWKRVLGNNTAASDSTQPDAAPSEPVAQAPLPQIQTEPVVSTVPEFKPLTPQVQVPDIVNSTADDKADAAPAPAASTEGLPDPSNLQKVKALPPSRYEGRARDRQYYLVP